MIMLMNKRTANDVRILQRSSIELMVTPTGFRNLDGWSRSVGLHGPSICPADSCGVTGGLIEARQTRSISIRKPESASLRSPMPTTKTSR